ncbi:LytR/AlgR family response regulator transcription factor [Ottowia testudinis]|uniref:Response regulator transcription factor n=1 Tax=Ottowia testudinis TaxID=2816950 RepID=A0A975CFL1_9BURK|nr:LytTR family DNA-binding domain-containing protein [Ottowia testudinis]QTD43942.1 response regulator transcription factor [Ottowia testudinis]
MTNPSRPTALIAEDEPLLAAALAAELARAWPELRIAATVGDGTSAVEQALKLRPDVLFFDIRMPGMSGLEAAAELADAWDESAAPFPALVFVTAYEQYAVQAFDAQALDYLVKPVQPDRLKRCVEKLRAAPSIRADRPAPGALLDDTARQLQQLMAALQPGAAAASPAQPRLRQLPVSPTGNGGQVIRMVPLADVLFLQAADKYVRVVTATGDHLLRTPLKDLLPQLDPHAFWQIHRSTAVRADAIDTVQRDEAGKLSLTVRGSGERLAVSRVYGYLFRAL